MRKGLEGFNGLGFVQISMAGVNFLKSLEIGQILVACFREGVIE